MEIVEGIYKLVQCEPGSFLWDLYIAKIVRHKDGQETLGWKIHSFGVNLSYGLNKIVKQQLDAVKIPEIKEKIKEGYRKYLYTIFDNISRYSTTVKLN